MTNDYAVPPLTRDERSHLLVLAREAITATANGRPSPQPDLSSPPKSLKYPAACFVTVRQKGQLRACTGSLIATQALVLEVARIAAQTATSDPRFPPIQPQEVDALEIEISVLGPSLPLQLDDPRKLPGLLRPGVDGVTLHHSEQRATFLPQVWHRIPDPVDFLGALCRKMGLSTTAWTELGMIVEVYQALSFNDANIEEESEAA